uniref:Post-translocation molecular chaperone n=1 Tax=Thermorudis sp. TaxID=1969470 RepID=A0A7C2WFE6_9BACT
MREHVRRWLRWPARPAAPGRRLSRREREQLQQRIVIAVAAVAIVFVLLLLGVGAVYQYLYLPRQVLVVVNGEEITRQDYWKVRKLELLNQISQYRQLATLTTGQQSVQYQQLADQAEQQLPTVEEDPVNESTLDQMIDNLIVVQRASELGVSVTDAELDEYLTQLFAPGPLASPTPTLGIDPTAAAWATATATASITPTPTPEPTPASAETPTGTTTPAIEPTVELQTPAPATPTPAQTPGGATETPSPAASPTPTIMPTATLSPGDLRATATASIGEYQRQVLERAGMSLTDFRRLFVRPLLTREKIQRVLEEQIPLRAEQVHAAHILLATEDAARSTVEELRGGADFAEIARQRSIDSTTAPNGGDLGWFPRGYMPEAFDAAAFSLQPGEVSDPVKTEYGWHIVTVLERENDRPLTVEMLQALRQRAFNTWLEKQRESSEISWRAGLHPMPTPETPPFMPPPNAPPTPTPTPSPTPTAPAEPTPAASPTP